MCGILFILSYNSERAKVVEDSLLPLVLRRGPDGCSKYVTSITTGADTMVCLQFHGTVLHLRGGLTKQPLVSDEGHVFLWNGEIFGGDVHIPEDGNDTEILFQKLCVVSTENNPSSMMSLFETIQGPWAFVFYDALNNNIWYGRDFFGRRTLISSYKEDTFTLSSLGHRKFAGEFVEVPAKVLYCINLEKLLKDDITNSIEIYKTQSINVNINRQLVEHRCLKEYNTDTNHAKLNSSDEKTLQCTQNQNNVNELDKGKCCACLNDSSSVYLQEQGDNLPDQEISSSLLSCMSCNIPVKKNNEVMPLESIHHKFLSILEEAVRKRVFNLPRGHCRGNEKASYVGILFSGGIDSVVLTALADRCIPSHESIDLINVAFAQKQKIQQNVKKKHQQIIDNNIMNFDVPDRITGRTALYELSRKRKWNFIEVDVTLEELQEARKSTITNLVYPLDSVLDDSIGCAIWFAARGVGRCYSLSDDGMLQLVHENYTSSVKVLITGMGADEQLGGYARHRTKFESFGWTGLEEEMKMELERISSRNLGRDDRCISDHGREARFPFLDENVVSFLETVPVCIKCDPRLPRGSGEKILLREAAVSLGLQYASNLPKRAIQFGSKIAKLESSKEKGGDNCTRLENVQIS